MDSLKERRFAHMADVAWDAAGDGVRRKVGPYDETMTAVLVEFDRGSVGYVHTHPHHQITYIRHGSFEVTIGEEKQVLGGGDFYYIPADVPHGVVALEDSALVDFFSPCRLDLVKGK